MAYHFEFDKIENTKITPRRTNNWGKSYKGKYSWVQWIVTDEDRGDGAGMGAQPHAHPEEQIIIALEGTMRILMGGVEYTIKPGDVFVIPPDELHEEFCDTKFVWYSIKNRIPGHSWYTTEWEPGAEEAWEEIKAKYDEMEQNFHEQMPPYMKS